MRLSLSSTPSLPLQLWLLIIFAVVFTVAPPIRVEQAGLVEPKNVTNDSSIITKRAADSGYRYGQMCGFEIRRGTLFTTCGGNYRKYDNPHSPTGLVEGVDEHYKLECDHILELQSLVPWIKTTLGQVEFDEMCRALKADPSLMEADSTGSKMLAAINTPENLVKIPKAVNQAKGILWDDKNLKTKSYDLGRMALQSYINFIKKEKAVIANEIIKKLGLAWPKGKSKFDSHKLGMGRLFDSKIQLLTEKLKEKNNAAPPQVTNGPDKHKLTAAKKVDRSKKTANNVVMSKQPGNKVVKSNSAANKAVKSKIAAAKKAELSKKV